MTTRTLNMSKAIYIRGEGRAYGAGVGLLLFFCACTAPPAAGPSPPGAPTGTANTIPPAAAPSPPRAATDRSKSEGSGEFDQYRFTYMRTGDEAEALFKPTRLPWNDSVVVAAARRVIAAAYGDKSENFPRPMPWRHQGETVNGIYLEGDEYEYVFVPIRGEEKDVRSLLFWRMPKGTAVR